MKGAKVEVEPTSFTQQTWTHSLHCHNGAVTVTKSTLYSNPITLSGPIASSFMKAKLYQTQTGKNKTTHHQKWHQKSDPENAVHQVDAMKHDAESSITI